MTTDSGFYSVKRQTQQQLNLLTVTVDPDETAHNEPSQLDLQCFCTLVLNFQHDTVYTDSFSKICRRFASSAFWALYGLGL